MDMAGGYPKSTGGVKYLMKLLDDYTNFGWTVFLGDKSGPTVVRSFRTWYASVKQLMGVHGDVRCVLTDNGTEWVNEDFRTMLVDLGIARELTAIDGPRVTIVWSGGSRWFRRGARRHFWSFRTNSPTLLFLLAQSPSLNQYRRPSIPIIYIAEKGSVARVNRRLRRYYLIVRLLPNVFALACLSLSSI